MNILKLLLLCLLSFTLLASERPKLCAALRGNGDKIFATISALSAITEKVGLVEAAAGGSSASIVLAIYEAILSNPIIDNIKDPIEKRQKIALLLKSTGLFTRGFFKYNSIGRSVKGLVPYSKIMTAESLTDISGPQVNQMIDAVFDLKKQVNAVYRDESLREFFYPTYDEKVDFHRNKQFFLGLLNGAAWTVRNQDTFFRPTPFSFDLVSVFFDSIASFYAGDFSAIQKDLENFLNRCSKPAFGKSFHKLEQIVSTSGRSCGDLFFPITNKYQTAINNGFKPSFSKREVGKTSKVIPIIGFYDDEKIISSYKQARINYRNAQPYFFDVNFKDFKIGYFGQPKLLQEIEQGLNNKGSITYKSEKFQALTNKDKAISWDTVFKTSPAEPGLAELKIFTEGDKEYLSLSGWPDLSPTLVLKNGLGCENVVYVTRTAPFETEFGTSIIKNLGATELEHAALMSPDKTVIHPETREEIPGSVYASLDAADAIWCTNWDNVGKDIPYLDINKFITPGIEAYSAPVYFPHGKNKFFKNKNLPELTEKRDGCAPGEGELGNWRNNHKDDIPELEAKAEKFAKLKMYFDYHVEGKELEGRFDVVKKGLDIYDQLTMMMPKQKNRNDQPISENLKRLIRKVVGSNGRLDYSDKNRLYHTLVFSFKQILGQSIRNKTPILRHFHRSRPYNTPLFSSTIESQVAAELREFDQILMQFGVGTGDVPLELDNYTYPREMLNFLRQDMGINRVKDLSRTSSAGVMPAIKKVLTYLAGNVQFPDGIPVADGLNTMNSFKQSNGEISLPEELMFQLDKYNRLVVRTYKPMCKCGSSSEESKIVFLKGKPEKATYFYKNGQSSLESCKTILRTRIRGEGQSVGLQCADRMMFLDTNELVKK